MKLRRAALLVGAVYGFSAAITVYYLKDRVARLHSMAMVMQEQIDWTTDAVITMEEAMPVVFVARYKEKLAFVILTQEMLYPDERDWVLRVPFWVRNFVRKDKED